uniref:BEN domain-containing protein 6-like n=1 Tax=Myxine glutinosa TaxID=7769 RepID=UPI00358FB903
MAENIRNYSEELRAAQQKIKELEERNRELRNALVLAEGVSWLCSTCDQILIPALNVKPELLREVERLKRPSMVDSATHTSSTLASSSFSLEIEEMMKHHMTPGDSFTIEDTVVDVCNTTNPKVLTKHLLMKLFSKEDLLTHSMTGTMSNSYPGKVPKPKLDPRRIRAIIDYVTKKTCCSESDVKYEIRTKLNNCRKRGRKTN